MLFRPVTSRTDKSKILINLEKVQRLQRITLLHPEVQSDEKRSFTHVTFSNGDLLTVIESLEEILGYPGIGYSITQELPNGDVGNESNTT